MCLTKNLQLQCSNNNFIEKYFKYCIKVQKKDKTFIKFFKHEAGLKKLKINKYQIYKHF